MRIPRKLTSPHSWLLITIEPMPHRNGNGILLRLITPASYVDIASIEAQNTREPTSTPMQIRLQLWLRADRHCPASPAVALRRARQNQGCCSRSDACQKLSSTFHFVLPLCGRNWSFEQESIGQERISKTIWAKWTKNISSQIGAV